MIEIGRTFRAMDTDIRALVCVRGEWTSEADEAEAALARVEATFREVEAVCSRFLPDSELSRLNAAAGRSVRVSPLLFSVIEAALSAASATSGVFDPTVLRALEAAGYDRTFGEIKAEGPSAASAHDGGRSVRSVAVAARRHTPAWRAIRLDAAAGTVTLPADARIDLGGIGKGWTVDRAAELLAPYAGAVVDAGGDISARGVQGSGEPWTVGVENPLAPDSDLAILELRDACAATSSAVRRRWTSNGSVRHHIIDPRTGEPSASGVLSATVVATRAANAEVLSKCALILGPDEGLDMIEREPDASGMLVLDSGRIRHTCEWPEEPSG